MLTAVVCSLAPVSGVANAQTTLPNCSYEGGKSDLGLGTYDDAPPKFIAWGNYGEFESYIGDPATDNGYVEVSAADPGRPIAHPYSAPHPTNRHFARHEVKSAHGDGPIKVVVSWEEEEYNYEGGYSRCRRYTEAIIETGPGVTPKFATRRSGAWLYPVSKEPCEAFADVPVRIVVEGERSRETLRQPGVCTRERTLTGSSRFFALKVTSVGAKFVPSRARTNDDWQFRYRAFLGQRLVKRGAIVVHNSFRPGRRIYGFHRNGSLNDAYWNYCVNRGETVWMDDGNPYCVKPARRKQRVVMR